MHAGEQVVAGEAPAHGLAHGRCDLLRERADLVLWVAPNAASRNALRILLRDIEIQLTGSLRIQADIASIKPEDLQTYPLGSILACPELRELVVLINRDQTDISLGEKALDVLAKLVDAPEQAAVRTISELSELLSVNASTLTRLSKKLGFAGFNDFQNVFRQAIADAGVAAARRPPPGRERT